MSLLSLAFLVLFSVDTNRVTLEGIRGVQGSDYINASFIDVSFY